MSNFKRAGLVIAAGLVTSIVGVAGPVEAHTTGIHDNCTNFNKVYKYGVGTKHARDKGGNSTRFKRSNTLYWRAERHNGDLDRDNDRIACEQA